MQALFWVSGAAAAGVANQLLGEVSNFFWNSLSHYFIVSIIFLTFSCCNLLCCFGPKHKFPLWARVSIYNRSSFTPILRPRHTNLAVETWHLRRSLSAAHLPCQRGRNTNCQRRHRGALMFSLICPNRWIAHNTNHTHSGFKSSRELKMEIHPNVLIPLIMGEEI